jgi:hypothetical protein
LVKFVTIVKIINNRMIAKNITNTHTACEHYRYQK